ncbi:MAG: DUF1493 family protein ['Candidatus Kapabacteria' thiocyanatum]|nr:DUF1493 family protein ['Candidatus Kapabacteria' thiocyanatum]
MLGRKKKERTEDNALSLVIDFVILFCSAEFGTVPNLSFLSEHTSLEDDLGITERDAENFIEDFVYEFDLDPADFRLGSYFAIEPDEEKDFATPVRKFLFGKREHIPVAKKDRQKLTLGMLAQAVVKGSLSW